MVEQLVHAEKPGTKEIASNRKIKIDSSTTSETSEYAKLQNIKTVNEHKVAQWIKVYIGKKHN